jgi:hypothetical protein
MSRQCDACFFDISDEEGYDVCGYCGCSFHDDSSCREVHHGKCRPREAASHAEKVDEEIATTHGPTKDEKIADNATSSDDKSANRSADDKNQVLDEEESESTVVRREVESSAQNFDRVVPTPSDTHEGHFSEEKDMRGGGGHPLEESTTFSDITPGNAGAPSTAERETGEKNAKSCSDSSAGHDQGHSDDPASLQQSAAAGYDLLDQKRELDGRVQNLELEAQRQDSDYKSHLSSLSKCWFWQSDLKDFYLKEASTALKKLQKTKGELTALKSDLEAVTAKMSLLKMLEDDKRGRRVDPAVIPPAHSDWLACNSCAAAYQLLQQHVDSSTANSIPDNYVPNAALVSTMLLRLSVAAPLSPLSLEAAWLLNRLLELPVLPAKDKTNADKIRGLAMLFGDVGRPLESLLKYFESPAKVTLLLERRSPLLAAAMQQEPSEATPQWWSDYVDKAVSELRFASPTLTAVDASNYMRKNFCLDKQPKLLASFVEKLIKAASQRDVVWWASSLPAWLALHDSPALRAAVLNPQDAPACLPLAVPSTLEMDATLLWSFARSFDAVSPLTLHDVRLHLLRQSSSSVSGPVEMLRQFISPSTSSSKDKLQDKASLETLLENIRAAVKEAAVWQQQLTAMNQTRQVIGFVKLADVEPKAVKVSIADFRSLTPNEIQKKMFSVCAVEHLLSYACNRGEWAKADEMSRFLANKFSRGQAQTANDFVEFVRRHTNIANASIADAIAVFQRQKIANVSSVTDSVPFCEVLLHTVSLWASNQAFRSIVFGQVSRTAKDVESAAETTGLETVQEVRKALELEKLSNVVKRCIDWLNPTAVRLTVADAVSLLAALLWTPELSSLCGELFDEGRSVGGKTEFHFKVSTLLTLQSHVPRNDRRMLVPMITDHFQQLFLAHSSSHTCLFVFTVFQVLKGAAMRTVKSTDDLQMLYSKISGGKPLQNLTLAAIGKLFGHLVALSRTPASKIAEILSKLKKHSLAGKEASETEDAGQVRKFEALIERGSFILGHVPPRCAQAVSVKHADDRDDLKSQLADLFWDCRRSAPSDTVQATWKKVFTACFEFCTITGSVEDVALRLPSSCHFVIPPAEAPEPGAGALQIEVLDLEEMAELISFLPVSHTADAVEALQQFKILLQRLGLCVDVGALGLLLQQEKESGRSAVSTLIAAREGNAAGSILSTSANFVGARRIFETVLADQSVSSSSSSPSPLRSAIAFTETVLERHRGKISSACEASEILFAMTPLQVSALLEVIDSRQSAPTPAHFASFHVFGDASRKTAQDLCKDVNSYFQNGGEASSDKIPQDFFTSSLKLFAEVPIHFMPVDATVAVHTYDEAQPQWPQELLSLLVESFHESMDSAAAALTPWLVTVPVANEAVDMACAAVRRAFCRYVPAALASLNAAPVCFVIPPYLQSEVVQDLFDGVRSALRGAKSPQQRRPLHFWAPAGVAVRLRDALTQCLEYSEDHGAKMVQKPKRVLLAGIQAPPAVDPSAGHRLLEHALKKKKVFAAVAGPQSGKSSAIDAKIKELKLSNALTHLFISASTTVGDLVEALDAHHHCNSPTPVVIHVVAFSASIASPMLFNLAVFRTVVAGSRGVVARISDSAPILVECCTSGAHESPNPVAIALPRLFIQPRDAPETRLLTDDTRALTANFDGANWRIFSDILKFLHDERKRSTKVPPCTDEEFQLLACRTAVSIGSRSRDAVLTRKEAEVTFLSTARGQRAAASMMNTGSSATPVLLVPAHDGSFVVLVNAPQPRDSLLSQAEEQELLRSFAPDPVYAIYARIQGAQQGTHPAFVPLYGNHEHLANVVKRLFGRDVAKNVALRPTLVLALARLLLVFKSRTLCGSLVGVTGSSKTLIMRTFSALLGARFCPIDVNSGLEARHIREKLLSFAAEYEKERNVPMVIFFDEFNTSTSQDIIQAVVMSRKWTVSMSPSSFAGPATSQNTDARIRDMLSGANVFLASAANPVLLAAPLNSGMSAADEQQQLARAQLLYAVQQYVHPTVQSVAWTLDPPSGSDIAAALRSMTPPSTGDSAKSILVDGILEAHRYLTTNVQALPFSLRDCAACTKVVFPRLKNITQKMLNFSSDEQEGAPKPNPEAARHFTEDDTAAVAVAFCYHSVVPTEDRLRLAKGSSEFPLWAERERKWGDYRAAVLQFLSYTRKVGALPRDVLLTENLHNAIVCCFTAVFTGRSAVLRGPCGSSKSLTLTALPIFVNELVDRLSKQGHNPQSPTLSTVAGADDSATQSDLESEEKRSDARWAVRSSIPHYISSHYFQCSNTTTQQALAAAYERGQKEDKRSGDTTSIFQVMMLDEVDSLTLAPGNPSRVLHRIVEDPNAPPSLMTCNDGNFDVALLNRVVVVSCELLTLDEALAKVGPDPVKKVIRAYFRVRGTIDSPLVHMSQAPLHVGGRDLLEFLSREEKTAKDDGAATLNDAQLMSLERSVVDSFSFGVRLHVEKDSQTGERLPSFLSAALGSTQQKLAAPPSVLEHLLILKWLATAFTRERGTRAAARQQRPLLLCCSRFSTACEYLRGYFPDVPALLPFLSTRPVKERQRALSGATSFSLDAAGVTVIFGEVLGASDAMRGVQLAKLRRALYFGNLTILICIGRLSKILLDVLNGSFADDDGESSRGRSATEGSASNSRRYIRISFGGSWEELPVHSSFRCIVIEPERSDASVIMVSPSFFDRLVRRQAAKLPQTAISETNGLLYPVFLARGQREKDITRSIHDPAHAAVADLVVNADSKVLEEIMPGQPRCALRRFETFSDLFCACDSNALLRRVRAVRSFSDDEALDHDSIRLTVARALVESKASSEWFGTSERPKRTALIVRTSPRLIDDSSSTLCIFSPSDFSSTDPTVRLTVKKAVEALQRVAPGPVQRLILSHALDDSAVESKLQEAAVACSAAGDFKSLLILYDSRDCPTKYQLSHHLFAIELLLTERFPIQTTPVGIVAVASSSRPMDIVDNQGFGHLLVDEAAFTDRSPLDLPLDLPRDIRAACEPLQEIISAALRIAAEGNPKNPAVINYLDGLSDALNVKNQHGVFEVDLRMLLRNVCRIQLDGASILGNSGLLARAVDLALRSAWLDFATPCTDSFLRTHYKAEHKDFAAKALINFASNQQAASRLRSLSWPSLHAISQNAHATQLMPLFLFDFSVSGMKQLVASAIDFSTEQYKRTCSAVNSIGERLQRDVSWVCACRIERLAENMCFDHQKSEPTADFFADKIMLEALEAAICGPLAGLVSANEQTSISWCRVILGFCRGVNSGRFDHFHLLSKKAKLPLRFQCLPKLEKKLAETVGEDVIATVDKTLLNNAITLAAAQIRGNALEKLGAPFDAPQSRPWQPAVDGTTAEQAMLSRFSAACFALENCFGAGVDVVKRANSLSVCARMIQKTIAPCNTGIHHRPPTLRQPSSTRWELLFSDLPPDLTKFLRAQGLKPEELVSPQLAGDHSSLNSVPLISLLRDLTWELDKLAKAYNAAMEAYEGVVGLVEQSLDAGPAVSPTNYFLPACSIESCFDQKKVRQEITQLCSVDLLRRLVAFQLKNRSDLNDSSTLAERRSSLLVARLVSEAMLLEAPRRLGETRWLVEDPIAARVKKSFLDSTICDRSSGTTAAAIYLEFFGKPLSSRFQDELRKKFSAVHCQTWILQNITSRIKKLCQSFANRPLLQPSREQLVKVASMSVEDFIRESSATAFVSEARQFVVPALPVSQVSEACKFITYQLYDDIGLGAEEDSETAGIFSKEGTAENKATVFDLFASLLLHGEHDAAESPDAWLEERLSRVLPELRPFKTSAQACLPQVSADWLLRQLERLSNLAAALLGKELVNQPTAPLFAAILLCSNKEKESLEQHNADMSKIVETERLYECTLCNQSGLPALTYFGTSFCDCGGTVFCRIHALAQLRSFLDCPSRRIQPLLDTDVLSHPAVKCSICAKVTVSKFIGAMESARKRHVIDESMYGRIVKWKASCEAIKAPGAPSLGDVGTQTTNPHCFSPDRTCLHTAHVACSNMAHPPFSIWADVKPANKSLALDVLCPHCSKWFCARCEEPAHEGCTSCDDAALQRSVAADRLASLQGGTDSAAAIAARIQWLTAQKDQYLAEEQSRVTHDFRHCPSCSRILTGCNRCGFCGTSFHVNEAPKYVPDLAAPHYTALIRQLELDGQPIHDVARKPMPASCTLCGANETEKAYAFCCCCARRERLDKPIQVYGCIYCAGCVEAAAKTHCSSNPRHFFAVVRV